MTPLAASLRGLKQRIIFFYTFQILYVEMLRTVEDSPGTHAHNIGSCLSDWWQVDGIRKGEKRYFQDLLHKMPKTEQGPFYMQSTCSTDSHGLFQVEIKWFQKSSPYCISSWLLNTTGSRTKLLYHEHRTGVGNDILGLRFNGTYARADCATGPGRIVGETVILVLGVA